MPWKPCDCCTASASPAHALIHLVDHQTGEAYPTRVPHEHRHDSVGWHDRPRFTFGTEDGESFTGVEHARGNEGVTVVTADGAKHFVPHGEYEVWEPKRELLALRKASEIKPGQRWITVHPNGKDEKGVPVLIQQNPDKTWRVVSGADGKLTHLRLTGIKSEREYKEEAKKKAKEKREKAKAKKKAAKEKKAKQTPEQDKKEEQAERTKEELELEIRKAERKFIEVTREKFGDVDEDLDRHKLQNMDEAARKLALGLHHKKQLGQAEKAERKAVDRLAEQLTDEAQARQALLSLGDEDPNLEASRELIGEYQALATADDEERAAERRARRTRSPGGKRDTEEVVEAAKEHIEKIDDLEERLQQLGGTEDDEEGEAIRDSLRASEELERRSLEHAKKAQDMLEAVESGEINDAAREALERAKLDDDADDEVVKEALEREAARQARRSEIIGARAEHFEDVEAEKGIDAARAQLDYADILPNAAKSVAEAKKMGLLSTDRVPVQDAEAAEIRDVVSDGVKLRRLRREYRAMEQAIEMGEYDRSRRAFTLRVSDHDQAAELKLQEQVQRKLTERLLGVANQRDQDYLAAVGNAHYNAMADVGLGIAGQRYLDRPTVDALGAKNAAILYRYGMEADGHDAGDVLGTLEEFHVDNVEKVSADALAKAEEFIPELNATIEDVGSMERAISMLDAHESDLEEVQRIAGSAIGKLEATATMSQVYRGELPDKLTIQGGDGGLDGTLQWMHAIGLRPEDYVVDYKKKNVHIPRRSWEKLMQRDSQEVLDARKDVAAIKRGEHDVEGWLPEGIIRRDPNDFDGDTAERPRFWQPIDHQAEDMDAELRDHLARRLADGEPASVIQRDMTDPVNVDQATDREDYLQRVHALFPLRDEEGKTRKASYFKDHYDGIVNDWMERTGNTGMDAQSIDTSSPKVQEAVFRTLADNPTLKHAHTPLAELGYEGRRAIRDHFYDRQGIAESRTYDEAFQRDYDRFIEKNDSEPDIHGAGQADAFASGPVVDPKWQKWRDNYLKLAQKYPKQGGERAMELLERHRPKSVRYPKLTDDHVAKLEALAEEYPHGTEHTLRDRMIEHYGPDKAPGLTAIEQYLAPELHQRRIDRFERRMKAANTPWSQYVDMHGSVEGALQSMQDELKGKFAEKFAEHHGRIAGEGLVTGPAAIHDQEIYAKAVGTPEEQAAFREQRRQEMEGLRARKAKGEEGAGEFASTGGQGSLVAKHKEKMEQDEAASLLQGSMFGVQKQGTAADWTGQTKPAEPEKPKTPAPDLPEPIHGERLTLGKRVEAQLRNMIPGLGRQLEHGKPIGLFPGLAMDGGRVVQQRVVKAFEAAGGRMGGWLGTGSGKSLISIAAFTHLHSKGKVDRGLYLVPVAVQDQFGGEMARFTKPGAYKWNIARGSHEERVAALRNPDEHMIVMTHQAYRDTVLKLMEEHHGKSREEMLTALKSADRHTAAKWMKEAMQANGIKGNWFTYFDEAHMGSSRGEDRSGLAMVTEMATHPENSSHMLLGTATPHKNDEAELYSMAAMIDPHKYGDRAKFMAAFGEDIRHNPDAIRRELEHVTYSEKIDPQGVERKVGENPSIVNGKKVNGSGPLKLEPEHQKLVDEVSSAYDAARKAMRRGQVDVDSIRVLSPRRFEGRPESEHEEIARSLLPSLAMSRDHALRRAINQAPPEINTKLKRLTEVIKHDLEHGEWTDVKTGEVKKGKPAVVFSDSKREIAMIVEHLRAQGIRAVAYHGGLSHDARDDVRLGFQPEKGEPKYDVLVGTAAMEAGVNLQRAKALHHYDVPMTPKSWSQRTGRAYRQKQRGDVDVHDWHVDHDYDTRARRRLRRKSGLASVFETPLGALDEHGIAALHQRRLQRKHQAEDLQELPLAAK